MNSGPTYFERPAAACVRGKTEPALVPETARSLFQRPLSELSVAELCQLIDLGRSQGLRLHAFKNTMGLPRVSCVLGILRSLQPANLLDLGTGRGAFLWPLLNEFPGLAVTAVDRLEHRIATIHAVARGGISNLLGVQADATQLPFPDQSFDVVTMLEVLEHIPDPARALAEACRVAARALVLSVPSKPDNNPEHIHLFTKNRLRSLFREAGMQRVNFASVLNHWIAVATKPSA